MYLYYILVQFMNWNWKMVVFDNFSFICNNLNRSCDMREINIGPSVNCDHHLVVAEILLRIIKNKRIDCNE